MNARGYVVAFLRVELVASSLTDASRRLNLRVGGAAALLVRSVERLDGNACFSPAAVRKLVMIRDISLFAGSDDHAQAAGDMLLLIAMAQLHHLEPEQYLRDLIRVLLFGSRERYLELAPQFLASASVSA